MSPGKKEKNHQPKPITSVSMEMEKKEQKQKQIKWNIDKEMLRYKIHYFLLLGGLSGPLSFFAVLAKDDIGISATALGIVSTTQQFLIILFKPFIGFLADYFNRLKAMIFILTIIQGIFTFMLLTIPKINNQNIENSSESRQNISLRKYDYTLFNKEEYKNTVIFNSSAFSCDHNFHSRQVLNSDYIQNGNDFTNGSSLIIFLLCSDNQMSSENDLELLYESALDFIMINKLPTSSFIVLCSLHNVSINFSSQNESELNFYWCYNGTNKGHLSKLMQLPKNGTQLLYMVHSKWKEEILFSDNSTNALNDKEVNIYKTYQFWLFGLYMIIINLAINSLFTLADTACYESLQNTGADYGRQRVWGAIASGMMSAFSGLINDITESYLATWCLMAVFCSLKLWNLSSMNLTKPHFSQSIFKDLKSTFKSVEFIAFEIGVFMTGISTAFIWFYLSWFIASLGGSQLLIGLAYSIECFCGQVPLMFFSGWIIKKIGHFNAVSLALFCYSVRFFWYSYVQNPWMLLPIEGIHGFTYGLFFPAVTSYAKMNAKLGAEATTQSVLCTTYEGVGISLGCIIGGIGFDRIGGQMTFYYAGIIWAFFGLINVISTMIVNRRKGSLNLTSSRDELTTTASTANGRF